MIGFLGLNAELRQPVISSLSTMTTIQTPGLLSEPSSGVQCIQRGFPSGSPLSALGAMYPCGRSCELECLCDLNECVSQETFAVTPMPWDSAFMRPSRTCRGPPIRSMSRDCESPGMRSAGDVKMIRREGYGRMRKYCVCVSFTFGIISTPFMYTGTLHSDTPLGVSLLRQPG